MHSSTAIRRGVIWTAAVVTSIILLTACLVAAVDTGHCRGLLLWYFKSRMGRPIQVNGMLAAHLFSINPSVTAARVVIGNPPWMPSGIAAEIGMLTVVLELPIAGHASGVVALDVQGATLYLARDSAGRANWQLTDPRHAGADENLPIMRRLAIPKAHVLLADALRHLQFDGVVSVLNPAEPADVQPLRIEGAGQLNGKAAAFEITGDPLVAASHKLPYHFTFAEHSNDSRLEGRGSLARPFNFDLLDATFNAAGPDMKDLYFLVGVSLVDTGGYHLSGKVLRRGIHTTFTDLAATFGQSDVQGTVSIESSVDRPTLALDIHSRLLRSSDLGMRAAGRSSEPESPLMLSGAMLSPDMLRKHDATVTFHAHQVDLGHLPLHEVAAKATIDDGVLTVAPLLAEVMGGAVDGKLRLDARHDHPAAQVDLKVSGLQLAQLVHHDAGPSYLEGPIDASIKVTGMGSSVHEIAASANGTVWAHVPHGAIRESLAELTGIDLRGLGLLLSKNTREVAIRCANVNFQAREGILTAQNLVVDTDPMLIFGEGQIHLDSEALDLEVRGRPKSLRLFRWRTPIRVRGTLRDPTIAVQKGNSTLLIADPGQTAEADCAPR